MKPINICPVKVGQQVMCGEHDRWRTVERVSRDNLTETWWLYTDGGIRRWGVISATRMCGMRVKNEAD